MFSLKVTKFFSYIYVYYLLHSSILDEVYGASCGDQSAGVNRLCAKSIRVTALTRQLDRGQSLFYDEPSNSLIFADGAVPSVYRYFIDTGHYYNITVGTRQIYLIVPVEDEPDTYFIAYGNDVAILNWNYKSGKYSYRTLGKQDPQRPYNQSLVAGVKVGRTQNRPVFFFSDPVLTAESPLDTYPTNISRLYSIDNGKKKTQLTDLRYGKGLGFSSDGKTIYYTDFGRNQTFKAFYNEKTNSLENKKLLQDFSTLGIGEGPNTMTVDAQGYIWICTQASKLIKVNPYNGNVECAITLPAPTSSVIFAKCPKSKSGSLDCIYVATRAYNTDRTYWNGRLLLIEGVGSTGILDYKIPLSTIYGYANNEHC